MCVQVVLLTELVGDGDAGEVLAPVTLDRVNVEEDRQSGEQTQEDQQEHADLDTFTVHVRAAKAEGRNNLILEELIVFTWKTRLIKDNKRVSYS